ncbi:pentatricopeptide repeat-containing protein [Pyrus ussuriensis x Pyrus communis]|uniref:Pentatricopeptide repeat-containing protein n=1 Tax=Pyrus ussuriensis x Pyrus communis TaxID=2448454 RepID=A0A5N5HBB3_9ROSA|nr:pentatricopeptide repeat-containing protein [Pyrus ussuriensis x Pyrus communis]
MLTWSWVSSLPMSAFNREINRKTNGGREGLWVFNDLKDRGYTPNIFMYTTMIQGLCTMGYIGEAMKLLVVYNTMILGFCKIGSFEEAKIFYKEMCDKGCKETTVGFCKEGKIVESKNLFRELLTQGLQPSTYTYTPLIEKLCLEPTFGTQDYILIGFRDQGYAAEGMEWFLDMLKSKLKPKRKTFGADYTVEKHICYSLVNKRVNNHFVETCLGEIIERK